MRFQWNRYWIPFGEAPVLGGDGFPVPPKRDLFALESNLIDFSAISTTPCLVLLGEPGIGKSYAMESLKEEIEKEDRETKDGCMLIRLNQYGNEQLFIQEVFQSEQFTRWQSGHGRLTFLLDGLDETPMGTLLMSTRILKELEAIQSAFDRLFLRITCRTAELPKSLRDGLANLWPSEQFRMYQLAPLVYRDVELAAIQSRLDPVKFMQEVHEKNAPSLASKPITLQFLLSIYLREGQFPTAWKDLFLKGCKYLGGEHNQYRQDLGVQRELSEDQVLSIAALIAAVVLFCNKPRITINEPPPDSGNVLPISEIVPSQVQANAETFTVGLAEMKEALHTGLFTKRDLNAFMFSHQTYAEFLAAWHLANSGIDAAQVGRLLRNPEDSSLRIVPQLRGVAGWLGGMDKKLFDDIRRTDPQVLLASDIANASDDAKSALIQSLLELLDSESIQEDFPSAYRRYQKLKHSRMADQLGHAIGDKTRSVRMRSAALRMAYVCDIGELGDLCATIALDGSEPYRLRSDAALIVAKHGSAENRRKLSPLVATSPDDPDDELKGYALSGLWPSLITPEEVFNNLLPQQNDRFFGAYNNFIQSKLVPALDPAGLCRALRWVAHQPARYDCPPEFGRCLIDEIMIAGWNALDRCDVFEEFARTAADRINKFDCIVDSSINPQTPRRDLTEGDRHNLIEAIIPHLTDASKMALTLVYEAPRLVATNDLDWLIERATHGTDPFMAKIHSTLIAHIYDDNVPGHFEKVYAAAQTSGFIKADLGHLFAPVPLGSPQETRMREYHVQRELFSRRMDRLLVRPTLPVQIEELLARYEAGEVACWWMLCDELSRDPSTAASHAFESDMTSLPSWVNADEYTQKRILEAAKKYIMEGECSPERWLGVGNDFMLFHPAAAGYKALLLLAKLETPFLEDVPIDVWRKWAPIVAGYIWENANQLEFVAYVYSKVPEDLISALKLVLDQCIRMSRSLSPLERFGSCWDSHLSKALLPLLRGDSLPIERFTELLKTMMKHECAEAGDCALSLINVPVSSEEPNRGRARVAAATLMAHDLNPSWPQIWTAMQSDREWGVQVMHEFARSLDAQRNPRLASTLPEDAAADFYIWLVEMFPYESDPDLDGEITSRHTISDVRDSILRNLENRKTTRACAQLKRIVETFPTLKGLRDFLIRAEDKTRAVTWISPTVREFVQIARNHSARLVRDGGELSEIVIESLGRLEKKLQGETPAAPDLWNESDKIWEPKGEVYLADYVKRHFDEDFHNRNIFACREVEIRRGEGQNQGERTDIHVSAFTVGDRQLIAKLIIEVKGCWNSGLFKDMQDQLSDRYLRDNSCRHGLYLVGWYNCNQWDNTDPKCKSAKRLKLEDTKTKLKEQAVSLSKGGQVIKSFVLRTGLR